jgi:hypothetical protein
LIKPVKVDEREKSAKISGNKKPMPTRSGGNRLGGFEIA